MRLPKGKARELAFGFGLAVALCALLACRPEVPAKFVEHSTLAQEAAIAGDHAEAARQWKLASQFADLEHVRDEAIYRQATSLKRAGQQPAADKILRALASEPGSRRERAAYDLATQALLASPSDGGKLLEATLVQFPGSGVARGAMDRWLRQVNPERRLQILVRLSSKITERTLSERMLLQRARTLELLGRTSEAMECYSSLIRDYPYPAGQYWDEALLHKASLQATLGLRQQAVRTLQTMLSHREFASIAGTYERRYAVATLMLARFLEPDDWQQAHTLLKDFPHTHPTSRELDEALWAAALLARDNNAPDLACEDVAALREADPNSRYAACGALVCPATPAQTTQASCRDYVANRLSSFEVVITRAAAPYYSSVNEKDRALERQQDAVPADR